MVASVVFESVPVKDEKNCPGGLAPDGSKHPIYDYEIIMVEKAEPDVR